MQAAGHITALPPIPFASFPAQHCADELRLYVLHGVRPGAALMALLSADAQSAYVLGHDDFRARIGEMVDWLHHHLPIACHGHRAIVSRWLGVFEADPAELDIPTFGGRLTPASAFARAA